MRACWLFAGVSDTGAVRGEAFLNSPTGDYAYEVPYFGVGSQFGEFLRVESLNNFNGRVRFPNELGYGAIV